MNAIQEALRGTRGTIRYIGQDVAAGKRRVAESKLLNAQLGYKRAAIESDLAFKQKDQQLRVDKFNLMKKANAPMALGDYLDLVVVDPATNEKVKAQIGEARLGKEYNANILSQAGNAILKQFGPKPTIEGKFAPGTVVETAPSGKKTVLQSPTTPVKTTALLTPKELIDAGLTKGTVAQKDDSGKVTVIQKPGDSDGDKKTFEVKIAALLEQFPNLSEAEATGLMTGTIEAVTNPVDGTTSLLNKITKEKTPFNLPEAEVTEEKPLPEDQKLFNLAGLVAGPGSAAKAGASVISGIVGGPVAEETIQARQFVTTAKNDLIRALSINPRFPVGEIKRIEKEIDIQPKIFDNKKVFQSKLIAIEKFLKRRVDKENSVANNPKMPVSARQEALKAASDIESFVKLMGIPKSIEKSMNREEKQAVWDGLETGESVFVDGVLKVKP